MILICADNEKALKLRLFVLATYTLFLAGFLFIPNAVDLYKYYIAVVFPLGLIYSFRTVALVAHSKLLLAVLLYLVYMLLTSFWSQNFTLGMLLYDISLAAYIIVFLLLTITIGIRNSADLDKILKLICVCAALSALISIPYWYSQHRFPDSRLISMGVFTSPNHSSAVYGFFCVLSSCYANQSRCYLERALYISTAVILMIFVFFTQSRAGIFATLVAISLLIIFSPGNKKKILGAIVAFVGIPVLFQLVYPLVFSRLGDISIPNRLEIWRQALDSFVAAPYFGQGIQTPFNITLSDSPYIYRSAHNTFIATVRDGGLIGLGFHLYILVIAIRIGVIEFVKRSNPIYLALLVLLLIYTSAATDQLIVRPREIWILLWLPIALLVMREYCHTDFQSDERTDS